MSEYAREEDVAEEEEDDEYSPADRAMDEAIDELDGKILAEERRGE